MPSQLREVTTVHSVWMREEENDFRDLSLCAEMGRSQSQTGGAIHSGRALLPESTINRAVRVPETPDVTSPFPDRAVSNEGAVEEPCVFDARRDDRRPIHPSWLLLSALAGDRSNRFHRASTGDIGSGAALEQPRNDE